MPKCRCIEYNYGDSYCPDCKLVHVAGGCCHYEHVTGPLKGRRKPVSKPGVSEGAASRARARPKRAGRSREDAGRIVDGQYVMPTPRGSRSNWKLPPIPRPRMYPLMAPPVYITPVPPAPQPPADVRVGGIRVPMTPRRHAYGRLRPPVVATPEATLRLMSKTPPKTRSSPRVPMAPRSGHIRMATNYGFSRPQIADRRLEVSSPDMVLPNYGRGQPSSKLKKYGALAPQYGPEPGFRYNPQPETRPIMR